jgi:hypothetical protein
MLTSGRAVTAYSPRGLVVEELYNLSPPTLEKNLLVSSGELGRRRELNHSAGSRSLIAVSAARVAGPKTMVVMGTFSTRAWRTASGIYPVTAVQARFAGVIPVVEVVSARVWGTVSKSIEFLSEGGYLVFLGFEGPLEFPNFVPKSIGSSLQSWDLVVVAVQPMETLLEIV